MLIILTICLVLMSAMLLLLKKSRESLYLMGLCVSLMLEICGVMIFIAKKGGISLEVVHFLYFSKAVQTRLQYFLITLNQLGYLIAIGRFLFPLFLVEMALKLSMVPAIRRNGRLQLFAALVPVAMLILYFPPIYRILVAGNEALQKTFATLSRFWIDLYLLFAIGLLLYELFSITLKFVRRQFVQVTLFLIALTGIYILYYNQDPGQVYRFYSYTTAWNKGIGYLQISPSIHSYMLLVVVNVICSVLGFYSLLTFTRGTYRENMEDVVMERKFDTAKIGASTFVHSMKNQLLSSRVIYKRIDQLYEQPELDTGKLKEYIDTLRTVNDAMLLRMEELYRCVKTKSIFMVPVEISDLVEDTLERFHGKYPEVTIQVENAGVERILADKVQLGEALYNLLVNAQEAVLSVDKGEKGEVSLKIRNERLYTVIEVRDNGCGMAKHQIKKIFEPFYSSKNSNSNWGMGLYYVREIVKSHLGFMRVDSTEGEGSCFYILLPKYQ